MCPQQWNCPRQWGKCLQQWWTCPQQWRNVRDSGKIEHGLGNLRVEIDNFDRLPIRIYGITCKKPIRI